MAMFPPDTSGQYYSEWYHVENLDRLLQQIKLGDRLEFKRCLGYCHWAIYSGYDETNAGIVHKIIHRSVPPDMDMSQLADNPMAELLFSKKIGKILESPLTSALPAGDRIRINNSLDTTTKPYEGVEVVTRALQLMSDSQQKEYSLAFNNCEHFVNECRYGIRYSEQVVNGCETIVNKACEMFTDDQDTRRRVQSLANSVKAVYQMIKTVNPNSNTD